VNISNHAGYDNQPSFSKDGKMVYYSSMTKDTTTDIKIYDIKKNKIIKLKSSPTTSEFSPTPVSNKKIAFVRVEEDGKSQRIWTQDIPKGEPVLMMDKVDSVGDFTFLRGRKADEIGAFILSKNENAHELRSIKVTRQTENFIDDSIGRCIRLAPDSSAIIYVKKSGDINTLMRYNFHNSSITEYFKAPYKSEDFVFYNNNKIWMAYENKLYEYWMAAKFPHWREINEFSETNSDLKNITRITLSPDRKYLVLVAEN
jgi:Tol biopolymer transport system component